MDVKWKGKIADFSLPFHIHRVVRDLSAGFVFVQYNASACEAYCS